MQASERVLSRRYSRALYESAKEAGEEKQVAEELAKTARSLSANMAAFKHPQVTAEEKKKKLGAALGKMLSKRTLRFLEILIEKKRFGLLPYMAADFERYYNDGRGVVHAAVKSAHKLSEGEKKNIQTRLSKFTGKEVILDTKEDPAILGGVIVRLGDWVFDASLKGKLRALRGKIAA